jgi:electron transport complex protein RnfG
VPGVPTRPEVPAWKLVLTLAVAGIAAGFLLVMLNQVTEPLIEKHARDALKKAIGEVLKEPARVESWTVGADALSREAEVNYAVDTKTIDRVFLGYDEADQPIGFAVAYEMAGFADQIRLIFGYDPRTRKVMGMRVLFSKETPGLGDKIEKDMDYVDSFDGAVAQEKDGVAELLPVKPGKGKGLEAEIDTITGATISTKKCVEIINAALAKLGPHLKRWVEEGAR